MPRIDKKRKFKPGQCVCGVSVCNSLPLPEKVDYYMGKKKQPKKPTHHHFLPHNTLECSHHETSNSECHGLWCRLLNAAIFFFICQQSVRIEKQYGEEMWKFLLVFLCVGVVDAASLKHRKRVRKSLRTGWREKKGNILRKHLESHLSCLIIHFK